MNRNEFLNSTTLIAAAIPFDILVGAVKVSIEEYLKNPSDENKQKVYHTATLIALKQGTENKTALEVIAENEAIIAATRDLNK